LSFNITIGKSGHESGTYIGLLGVFAFSIIYRHISFPVMLSLVYSCKHNMFSIILWYYHIMIVGSQ